MNLRPGCPTFPTARVIQQNETLHKKAEVPAGLEGGSLQIRHVVNNHADGVEDRVIDELHTVAERVSKTAANIASMHNAVMADSMFTALANAKRSKAATEKALEAISPRIQEAHDLARKRIDALTMATQPPTPKTPVDAILAGQICDVLRSMSPEERMKVLRENLSDARFIGFALHGNAVLSGLTHVERNLVLSDWRHKNHAPELKTIKGLSVALDRFKSLSELLITWGYGLHQNKNAALAAAERSAELAEQAIRDAAG